MIARMMWLVLVLLLVTGSAWSCSVCFGGDPDSLAVIGMSNGILTLLLFVLFLWCSFGAFFIYLWKKSKQEVPVL